MFQRFLKTVPFRVIFGWSTVISAVLGLSTLLLVTHANRALGIDDRWFSMGDSLVLTVMGQIAYMPILVLAARLCPPGVEATLFALLMSVVNLAGLVSYESGAVLMHWMGITESDFTNLALLVIITNLTTLLPLPLLGWLPAEGEEMPDTATQPSLQAVPVALDLDPSASKHLEQPFIPDLVTELVSSRRSDSIEEPAFLTGEE